jgi:hypothetical protein
VLILESAVFLVVSPLSGALVSRVGPRWLMTAGILAVLDLRLPADAVAVDDRPAAILLVS